MNRIDRLQAIIIQLQTKKVITAQEIANRFEISVRTVYRDIRALEEGGVPIGAEAGVGYFLMEGYHLPPVMFTRDEALTLLLAGKFMEKATDRDSHQHYSSALSKIKAVLDTRKKEELEGVNEQIIVDPFKRHFTDQSGNLVLSQIQSALPQNKVLQMDYWSNYIGEFNERHVEPIGLCYYGSQWHLIAWCRLRNDYRDFRIDRISKLKILEEVFTRENHVSLRKYIENLQRQTDLEIVRVEMSKERAGHITDVKYQFGWLNQVEKNGKIVMDFALFSHEFLSRWLLTFGSDVVVLEPESIKERIKELIAELQDHYSIENLSVHRPQ